MKNTLRKILFLTAGQKRIDYLRYLKFSYLFSRLAKIKDLRKFVKSFSNFYEPEMQTLPRIIKNPRTIIDIGANYGTYSFFLSRVYPDSKIIAFEPGTSSFKILNKIINRFKLRNVFAVKEGLGQKEEQKEIVMPKNYTIIAYVSDGNAKKGQGDSSEKIKITTLDAFSERNKINDIDFIKCDVEGFELNVFLGSKKTLAQMKPFVLVEIEERHTKKYGILPSEVSQFMKKLGYHMYSVKGNEIIRTEVITKEIPLYLFAHKDKIKS